MELLKGLIGKKVTVFSETAGGERQDVGMLDAVDLPFFKVTKADGDELYFTIHQVRLIKPF